jgi:hypothetical protein
MSLKRTTPLKRTPFKPRSVLTRSLRPESKSTHAKMRERRAFTAAFRAEHPFCEARASRVCRFVRQPTRDVHEPWSRGRGGPVNDERNSLSTCRSCHRWIHENPEMAEVRGLLIPSHEGAAWLARGGCQAVRK